MHWYCCTCTPNTNAPPPPPHPQVFMHEISIEHDLDWVDCADQEEAHEFRAELGHDKCDIRVNDEGQWKVRLKRGAVLAIPKALQFDRTVAGQIPTG